MTKFFKKSSYYLAAILLASCTSEETDDQIGLGTEIQTQNLSLISSGDVLYDTLIGWGYKADQIEDLGEFYLVDGDMVFDKSKSYSDPTLSRIDRNIVTQELVNIWIHPDMDNSWIDASNEAVKRWNAQLEDITLITVTDRDSADMEILYDSLETDDRYTFLPLSTRTFGRVEGFPTSDGKSGSKAWLNPDFNACFGGVTQSLRIANVQHEIGHNLGFHHTNRGFGFHIEGTPTSDPRSVMNGGSACRLNDFSEGDVLGIKIIYGVGDAAGGLLDTYSVPRSTGIPNGFRKYSNVHTIGANGPNLDNVFNSVLNWWGNSNNPNALYQFTLETNDGTPRHYTNISDFASYQLHAANPEITINSSSGFSNLSGDYWLNLDGDNLVLVEKSGAYALYFSNSSEAPSN
ncbi:zinc metalloprotease [Aquimarina agarilytica]|uniref:glycosyl hydrolase family 5 n=1 Tax=Aquimarina agarilytica TaxID=1087449 RepID=UPI000289701F|nr:glycosyl hydrolase family 5 [Aquimarina agarilytica]